VAVSGWGRQAVFVNAPIHDTTRFDLIFLNNTGNKHLIFMIMLFLLKSL
jgi:hypothetical protein